MKTYFKATEIRDDKFAGKMIGNTKSPSKYHNMGKEQFYLAVKDRTVYPIKIEEI